MEEHGSYSFEWQGDILVLSLFGGFNEQAINRFFLQVTESILTSARPRWVLLSSVDEAMLGSPEVISIIKSAYMWGIDHGCVAAAISGANLVVRSIFSSYFEDLAFNTQNFDEKSEALLWLTAQLKENE